MGRGNWGEPDNDYIERGPLDGIWNEESDMREEEREANSLGITREGKVRAK